MKEKMSFKYILQIVIAFAVFWILDFVFHYFGVGESNFYYLSKFGNAVIFSVLWFLAFQYKEHWKKIVYSFIFGTWISSYYLLASYSGFVQYFGIPARYTPPPFVIGGIYLSPILWWFFHAGAFYLGIVISELLDKKK
ncbi:MAG: hypothetical protein AABW82_04735 [Nanoarchaeota archaeon]